MKEMVKAYKAAGAAQGYILGYVINGELNVRRFVTKEVPEFCFKMDMTSADDNGVRYECLRFRPTKREKLILSGKGTPMIVKGFNSKAQNLGEELERAIRAMYGQDTAKDSRPFWQAADVMIYGVGYEIKFDDATWVTERELRSL